MNTSLLGFGQTLLPVPGAIWQRVVKRGAVSARQGLAFMSDDHHRVRDYVVMQLPRKAAPLTPEMIAENLELPLLRVITILDELEKHMTFLFRSGGRDVVWAYPVTAEPTPHKIFFSSGEQIYGA